MTFELNGVGPLEKKLISKSRADFDEVGRKNVRGIYSRSQKAGGTPVDSNELRISAKYRDDEFGYSAPHSPHVEYGHLMRNGVFLPGQYFLKRNVDAQRPIYKQDLKNKLKE
ncbi:HK97 gp10 family phage protein [Marinilactibacillus psychrotolerans]|uniref:HK97 gp10 family phage protein n=1 Tax=Marinilactibacillus psychrotolerans TaxID=191770 RepID=A0A5R9C415_9LACT|nr:HK97 gp10 family phage protein [Marinilactibacillus psychrotolerans]TLQ07564.1 HK97 gp10 family phage protein [Marinilactibacillus psychrotolerans]